MSELPYSSAGSASEVSSLRLVSSNLQHGRPANGWDGKNSKMNVKNFLPDPREAREILIQGAQELKSLNPDILLVQELDMYQHRSGNIDQAECIAEVLGMDYWACAPAFSGHVEGIHYRPRSFLAPTKRGYGLALFSRFPIRRSLSLSLPGRKNAEKHSSPVDLSANFFQRGVSYAQTVWKHWKNIIKNQPRIVQGALVDTPLGTLALGNTHLETHTEVAKRQTCLSWQSLYALDADAYILAGDFNLSPKQVDDALDTLDGTERPALHHAACSFPAWEPRHHIDQFLLHGLNMQEEPQTQRLSISDHLAVICDLTRCEEE